MWAEVEMCAASEFTWRFSLPPEMELWKLKLRFACEWSWSSPLSSLLCPKSQLGVLVVFQFELFLLRVDYLEI